MLTLSMTSSKTGTHKISSKTLVIVSNIVNLGVLTKAPKKDTKIADYGM